MPKIVVVIFLMKNGERSCCYGISRDRETDAALNCNCYVFFYGLFYGVFVPIMKYIFYTNVL